MRGAIDAPTASQIRVHPERFTSQPHVTDAELLRVIEQYFPDRGMQMQVQMAIDVVEFQARGAEFFKLRVDFLSQFVVEASPEKISDADFRRAVGKFTP